MRTCLWPSPHTWLFSRTLGKRSCKQTAAVLRRSFLGCGLACLPGGRGCEPDGAFPVTSPYLQRYCLPDICIWHTDRADCANNVAAYLISCSGRLPSAPRCRRRGLGRPLSPSLPPSVGSPISRAQSVVSTASEGTGQTANTSILLSCPARILQRCLPTSGAMQTRLFARYQ